MKALKLFFFIILTFSLYNCGQEVPPVEPDKDEDIEIEDTIKLEKNYIFRLNGISSYDSIYLYEDTYFRCTLTNLQDSIVPIEKISFILHNEPINSSDYGKDWLVLGYREVPNIPSTLDVKVQIADSINDLNFRFKILKAYNHKILIQQETTPEGFFKIYWNKLPDYKNLTVEKHVLNYKGQYPNEIEIELPASATYFVDTTYVYGLREYTLKTYFAAIDTTLPRRFINTDYSAQYYKYTTVDFSYENIDGNRARLSWRKNDFNCVYSIYVIDSQGFNQKVLKHDETSVEFDRKFPEVMGFQLFFHPVNQDLKKSSYEQSVYWVHMGKYLFLGEPKYLTKHVADVKNRVLYFLMSDRVLSYDADKMQQISSYTSGYDHLSVSQPDSRVAIVKGTTFYVFKDATLKNPLVIEGYKSKLKGYTYAAIGGEFLVSYNRYDNKADVYDSKTGKNLFEIPIGNNNTNVILSRDGKYLVLYEPAHYGNLSIYKLSKTGLNQIYSKDDWWVDFCEFDPCNPNFLNLVLRYGRGYSVFDISKCEVVESVSTKYGKKDPFTGNWLYSGTDSYPEHYVVCDNSRSKVLYKIRAGGSGIEFFNNFLFAEDGSNPSYYFCLDIKDYLAK